MTDRDEVLRKLVDNQYTRNDQALGRGTFRVRGETLEVFPAYAETAYRAVFFGDEIESIQHFDPLTGEVFAELEHAGIWPATHYATDRPTIERAVVEIRDELEARCAGARGAGQAARVAPAAPAHPVRHGDDARARLLQRHRELLAHPRRPRARRAPVLPARLLPGRLRLLHRRVAPDRPADRRHVRGRPLAQADARGVRLPAAERARQPARRPSTSSSSTRRRWCSCRPRRATSSATTRRAIVEQIVRPTGVVDPEVDVRETKNQIDDLMEEIRQRVEVEERTLVTTLTKKMAEDLTDYLLEYGFKVRYLHSEIDTLERIQIIRELRLGEFDVLVGVNLLREGLDLPGGVARGDPRRRQGGLPARRDLADPDDRPRRPQHPRQGDHVRRQGDGGDAQRRSRRRIAAARSRSPTTRSTASRRRRSRRASPTSPTS